MTVDGSDNAISDDAPLLRLLKMSASGSSESALVPIADNEAFSDVTRKICALLSEGSDHVVVLADGDTVHEVVEQLEPSGPGRRIIALGASKGVSLPKGVESVAVMPAVAGPREAFMVVLSPALSAVAVMDFASRPDESGDRPSMPAGYWYAGRDVTLAVAEKLLLGTSLDVLPEEASGSWRVDEPWRTLMQVASSSLERSIAGGKSIELARGNLMLVLEILKNISTLRRAHDILYIFTESMARAVHMARCSVVRIWKDKSTGYVVASHEDATVRDIPISLDKYPEILQCLDTKSTLVIEDAQNNPVMAPVRDSLKRAGLNSLMVTPILMDHEEVGTLVLRAARHTEPFTTREVHLCEIVANAAANALERAHLFESIQAANHRLEQLAITDELTGLHNQRYFKTRLMQEFQRADRYHVPLSCLIMDIDDFKKVNDTWGHLKGDVVLRQLARGMLDHVRRTDVLARYGGEEFVLVMPQTDADGALIEATRLHDMFGGLTFTGMDQGFRIHVSCGVATFEQGNMATPEALLRCADVALYRAKNSGKDRVEQYHDES